MNYSEFRFHVAQRYVRDVWIEYRLTDQSCVINAELKSGEVKELMLSNADGVHRYKSCDTAIKTIVNSGWVRTLRVRLDKQKPA